MANVIVDDTYLKDIADAIREKNGREDTYTPSEMAAAITSLSSGGGSLAYATLTHNTGSTSGYYRTFDLTNYITPGTIYFLTQYQTTTYVCIIENGAIAAVRYGTSGSIFASNGSSLSAPTFALTDGIMKVSGSSSSNLKNSADVIYTA